MIFKSIGLRNENAPLKKKPEVLQTFLKIMGRNVCNWFPMSFPMITLKVESFGNWKIST